MYEYKFCVFINGSTYRFLESFLKGKSDIIILSRRNTKYFLLISYNENNFPQETAL